MKIKYLIVAILLIGLSIYYFAEALFFNSILTFRDLARYFYPLRLFTASSIKAGIMPLWNPYIFCGTPHLALQQSAIFYPLSIVYYIFPFDFAFNLFLVLHIFLAGLFVYLLCKRWQYRDSSSIIAAVIFMFSGYMIFVMNLATTLGSVIWLPLALLFFDKALYDKSLKYTFLSAITLAVMFLAGEPSIFYTTLWVLLFYAIFFWANNREHCKLANVSCCYFGAAAFSILLASIQLLPFLELMRFTDRTLSIYSFKNITRWSLQLKDTFSFLIPFLTRTDFSKDSYWREQNWVIMIYVGVFSALLILLSLFAAKKWRTKFLFFAGTFFLLVSYGSSTPFYYLIYKFIPGFSLVRYPARFLYVTTFCIAMLCGVGFDAYIKRREEESEGLNRFFSLFLFILLILSAIFLAIYVFQNDLTNMIYDYCKKLDIKNKTDLLFSLIAAVKNTGRFLGFFTAGGILLFLGIRLKDRIGQAVLSFSLISLILADLFTVLPARQLMLNSNFLRRPTPNIEYLKKDNSLFRFVVSPKTSEANNFLDEKKNYEEAIYAAKDMLTADYNVIFGLQDVSGYDSIRLANNAKVLNILNTSPSPSSTNILNMLNVKYIISSDRIDEKKYRLVNEGAAYVYENLSVLPRAFLVGSHKVLKDEVDIANRLKSKEFDPSKEVILEEEPRLGSSGLLGNRVVGSEIKERVEITKYSLNEVVVNAVVDSPKFLVLSDSYYPGWKAYVDGRPVPVYKADFMLRAVSLEPGSHVILFLFRPFSFLLGLIISLGTLIFMVFYIVIIKK